MLLMESGVCTPTALRLLGTACPASGTHLCRIVGFGVLSCLLRCCCSPYMYYPHVLVCGYYCCCGYKHTTLLLAVPYYYATTTACTHSLRLAAVLLVVLWLPAKQCVPLCACRSTTAVSSYTCSLMHSCAPVLVGVWARGPPVLACASCPTPYMKLVARPQ